MIVNMNPNNSTIATGLKQANNTLPSINSSKQQTVIVDEYDDDLMNEGYLPEIYFSLRSDNPAEW